MKFIQILFSTEMVQALIDNRKTQTRRVVKSRHESGLFQICRRKTDGQITSINSLDWDGRNCEKDIVCPYGQVGDILWVRENYCPTGSNQYLHNETNKPFFYAADIIEKGFAYSVMKDYGWKMKPSIHMPKEACRIFLKITNVRVERLWDITEEDSKAEGAEKVYEVYKENARYKLGFMRIWEKINGKESLESNPFVWVIEFERIEKPENFI